MVAWKHNLRAKHKDCVAKPILDLMLSRANLYAEKFTSRKRKLVSYLSNPHKHDLTEPLLLPTLPKIVKRTSSKRNLSLQLTVRQPICLILGPARFYQFSLRILLHSKIFFCLLHHTSQYSYQIYVLRTSGFSRLLILTVGHIRNCKLRTTKQNKSHYWVGLLALPKHTAQISRQT
jgi:hypothetical protein